MSRAALASFIVPLLTLCISVAGCSRSPAPSESSAIEPAGGQVEQQTEPPPEGSHELKGMTVSVADPEGGWTFDLKAASGTGESLHGPWELQGTQGTYETEGRPPILMSATRAHLDEEAQHVSFDGDVVLESQGWRLAADHVEYDLATGEVVATGQTN
ncbi:MAG: hypothetical protein JXA57_13460 [Armatimonadetes bacterium]|nr:hypothetical protein [Armatimonadota bacterium]